MTCEAVHGAPAAEGGEGDCGGRVQDFKVLLAVRRRDRSLQDEARADGSQEVEGKDGGARQAGLPAKQLQDSWVAHM